MANYKDLQTEAKKLGIPYIDIPRKELEASIKAAKKVSSAPAISDDASNSDEPVPESGSADSVEISSKKESEAKNEDKNTAIVTNMEKEVRRYTRKNHGEQFADLAKQFASKHKYSVELKKVEPGMICPSCGHEFHPS